MKIAIVSRCSQVFPDIRGGADLTAIEYALALESTCDSVSFIGRGSLRGNNGKLNFIKINSSIRINSKSKIMYFLKAFILVVWSTVAAATNIRKERPAIVYTFSSFTTIILKRMFKNLPVVYTVVDPVCASSAFTGLESVIRYLNNWLMEKKAIIAADWIIAISNDVKEQILQLGLLEDKVTVLYPMPNPFLDGEMCLADNQSLKDVIKSPYILSVGSQMGRKRFDILIEATRYVDNRLKLVLVGNGSQRKSLELLASLNGVREKIKFIDGVDDIALSILYKNSQLYVLVSEREGFPISTVESATHGTPVLYFNPSISTEEYLSQHFLAFNNISPVFIAERINERFRMKNAGEMDRIETSRWAKGFFSSTEKIRKELTLLNETLTNNFMKKIGSNSLWR